MDQELSERFQDQEKKLDAIYVTVEKLRKYFFWTLVITVVTVVLPLIAMIFAVPWMIHVLSTTYLNIQ